MGNRRRLLSILWPSLAVVAMAGCAEDAAAPRPVLPQEAARPGVQPLATLWWNQYARDMIVKHKPNQQAALRGMAYLTLAQYVGIELAQEQKKAHPASTLGAIAGASAVVLTYLYPADSAEFEAQVRAREAELDPGLQYTFRGGESVGRAAGRRAVARARDDRFHAPWNGTVPTGPGIWFSSTVPPTPPALPMLGQMEPFFMTSGSQFRPAPPPAFGGAEFLAAVAEVRDIAQTRTAEQDSIAKFWAMGTGTLIAGFWNSTAAALIEHRRLDEREAAHALALMNTAAMDGLIACADAKFTYWLLRPSQADPAISLAIGLPNFPSYPSNHACFSGAAAYVVGALFPGEKHRLAGMAGDAAISRVYGGIHYRFDGEVGLGIGEDVGRLAVMRDRHNWLRELLPIS